MKFRTKFGNKHNWRCRDCAAVVDKKMNCVSCGSSRRYHFHSLKEGRRYSELFMLQKAGEISGLKLQPSFPLRVICPDETEREIGEYRADFEYIERGHTIIEDVKSRGTLDENSNKLYHLKKKFVEAYYGIKIRET